jgi:hypothetical protein
VPDYQVSAAYVNALLRALSKDAVPGILEVIEPAALATMQNPWSDPWHPAIHLEALGAAVLKVHDGQVFEDMHYRAMTDRYADIVLPLVKRSLAANQRSPAPVLNALPGLIEMGMQGLETSWKKRADASAGTLYINYPRRVAPLVEHSWRGVLRFVFEFTQSNGKVTEFTQSPDGKIFQFKLEW